jgi:uncharacterized protein
MQIAQLISRGLALKTGQVERTVALLSEGATIPFISRYRKEQTGGLDEVEVARIRDQKNHYDDLEKRKAFILKSLEEQEVLTAEMKKQIDETWDSRVLEDIYLPFKPKRKTKGVVARERGLEALAKIIMAQREPKVRQRVQQFVNKEVGSVDEAIEGAQHIIAEWVNENETSRNKVRKQFEKYTDISAKLVKGKEEQGQKYKDYFSFSERLNKIPSHRLLAIRRAENEGILRVSIGPDKERTLEQLNRVFVKNNNESGNLVEEAVKDAYQRLLKPSIETEFKNASKEKADDSAIDVFSTNLRQLLLAPPLGQKRILALDPGFRTGCKVVCLNEHGALLHNETIYPHPPQRQFQKASSKIAGLVNAYKIEAIAIGNGTAGRETENLIQRTRFDREVKVFIVNEDGASVYSASKIAREEFPSYDVTVRGSVSIGRRLMDPLAELVKIDPKAIGVGQYQHDVDQAKLKKRLDETVESCVNNVGVELNTAGKHLLAYVSGLGPALAQNVVDYRAKNGAFSSRAELKKVPRLGEKAFEQAAGFLRISDAKNPLDNSAVHPESYFVVKKMARQLGVTVEELIGRKSLLQKLTPDEFITDEIGLPTVNDILDELAKPGRDPRSVAQVFSFSKEISSISDVKEGMTLPGIVSNITNFGAFVDLGIKENGLLHISQITDRFISNPSEELALHQQLKVKVTEVDEGRKRIGLTLKF